MVLGVGVLFTSMFKVVCCCLSMESASKLTFSSPLWGKIAEWRMCILTKGTQQSDICLLYLINMIVHLLVFWSFYMHIFMWFPALIFIYSYKIQRAIRWQIKANSKMYSRFNWYSGRGCFLDFTEGTAIPIKAGIHLKTILNLLWFANESHAVFYMNI